MDRSSSATRRRSSIAASGKFSLYLPHGAPAAAAPPPPINLELLSINPSPAYTSLRDVLPAVSSGGGAHGSGAPEIPIRNRLVKQAAWAYLQPMSASPSYSGAAYFHNLRSQFSGGNPLAACRSFLSWVFDRILREIGFPTNRNG